MFYALEIYSYIQNKHLLPTWVNRLCIITTQSGSFFYFPVDFQYDRLCSVRLFGASSAGAGTKNLPAGWLELVFVSCFAAKPAGHQKNCRDILLASMGLHAMAEFHNIQHTCNHLYSSQKAYKTGKNLYLKSYVWKYLYFEKRPNQVFKPLKIVLLLLFLALLQLYFQRKNFGE